MASRRQIKKKAKAALNREALKKIQELQNLKVENDITEKEIKRLQLLLKRKKATLQQLQNSIREIDTISTNLQKTAVARTQRDLPIEIAQSILPDSARAYTAIKKYNEYVDKGIIKEHSVLDKYQIQEFMEKIMSDEEYEDYIKESVKKGEDLLRKDEERQLKHAAERSRYTFSF